MTALQKLIEEHDKITQMIGNLSTDKYIDKYICLSHYLNGIRFAIDLLEKEDK